jgi:threonine dehydrogenase-like Zn-dependent dehydrogenase
MKLPETAPGQKAFITTETVMKAAVITEPGKVQIREFPLPVPGQDQVRIRLQGSGVCASNIPVFEGRPWFNYPLAPGEPGHEGWGIIDAVGNAVTALEPGQRVCFLSQRAYATHDIAQADQIVPLPGNLDDIDFPGEPLGCVMNIFSRSEVGPGHTVAITGLGFLGLLLTQLCKSAGARVIAISRRPFSLEAAKICGADDLIIMDDHWKIIEMVKKLTSDNLCDRVIEATGIEWPLNLSIEITRTRGKLIVAGYHQDGMRQVNMQMLNWRGIDMINAHERDPREYLKGMKKAIEAVEEGLMNPRPLYSHRLHLDDISTAFDHLIKRPDGFIKALIVH